MSTGALNDGRKSLARYYLNNFLDAYRQQTLDLCQSQRSPMAVLREGVQIEVRVVKEESVKSTFLR